MYLKSERMRNIRLSVHSAEHTYLRQLLIRRRLDLGHSFVGKVETGDRRLDIFEFIDYCRALNWQPEEVLQSLQKEAV